MTAPDTYDRSLAHWSEASRAEMDAFYQVASLDYRELVRAWDFRSFFEERLTGRKSIRILDVACGSGKFPAALRTHALGDLEEELVLDLLDPSAFSLAEARASLEPPFYGGRDLHCTLQRLPRDVAPYEVVWAVHALYAVPQSELDAGVAAFMRALAPNGLGLIAQGRREAHYLAFYEAYRSGRNPDATPYTSAEDLLAAFERMHVSVEVKDVTYEQRIENEAVLEGFLQRCLFDDSIDLAAMRRDPHLGPYLAARRREDGTHVFRQRAAMIFIRHRDDQRLSSNTSTG